VPRSRARSKLRGEGMEYQGGRMAVKPNEREKGTRLHPATKEEPRKKRPFYLKELDTPKEKRFLHKRSLGTEKPRVRRQEDDWGIFKGDNRLCTQKKNTYYYEGITEDLEREKKYLPVRNSTREESLNLRRSQSSFKRVVLVRELRTWRAVDREGRGPSPPKKSSLGAFKRGVIALGNSNSPSRMGGDRE